MRNTVVGCLLFAACVSAQWESPRVIAANGACGICENNGWSIAAVENRVHAVYWGWWIVEHPRACHRRSLDTGVVWDSFPQLLSDDTAYTDLHLSVCASGLNVHLVHERADTSQEAIVYTRSTDGGVNWGSEYRLVQGTGEYTRPCIACEGQSVHAVWEDSRGAVFYRRSQDGGTVW